MKVITKVSSKNTVYNSYTNEEVMSISFYPFINEINILGWSSLDSCQDACKDSEVANHVILKVR